jgi:hypothetical protein
MIKIISNKFIDKRLILDCNTHLFSYRLFDFIKSNSENNIENNKFQW